MNPAARRSLVGAFVLLSVVGLFRSCEGIDEVHPTTLSAAPWGFGAFYELSVRLFPHTGRARGSDVRDQRAVWWLPRATACLPDSVATTAPWPLRTWVEAGGTAVIPLPGGGEATCRVGRNLVLPARARRPRSSGEASVDGPGIVARPRSLPTAPRTFEEPGDEWRVRLRAGSRPFVIERPFGDGRLVVVADASFLTNARLGDRDAALLAAELVETWGPPAFDDGTAARPSSGAIGYVVRSIGAIPLSALIAVGLVIAWYGTLVPARPADPSGPPSPRLDDFVRSLGRLHRQSRDWNGLLARHRAWAVAALAPKIGLAARAPSEAVLDRLGTLRGAASVAPFEDATPVTNERELERRFAAIAAVVEEVSG